MIRLILFICLSMTTVLLNGQNKTTHIDTIVLDDMIERLDSMFENGILFPAFDEDFEMTFDEAFPDMREFILGLDSLGFEEMNIDTLFNLHQEWDFSDEDMESMMNFGMQLFKSMDIDSLNDIFKQFDMNDFDLDFMQPFLDELSEPDTIKQDGKPLKKI